MARPRIVAFLGSSRPHGTGCATRNRQGRLCIFRDDGERRCQAAIEADVLLVVTPVHWGGPTSIMKTFLDRVRAFGAGLA